MNRFTVLILFLTIGFSCKKDPEIPYCELHPDDCVDVREVKDYFYFKLGSYWVYEEENTGMRDSVYVIETYSDTSSYYFTTTLKSSYDGYRYRHWPGGGATSDADDNIVKKSERSTSVWRSKGKAGDFVGESTCFLFYPTPGLWTYSYGLHYGYDNILEIDTILPEYDVYGNNYLNVIIVSEEHTASEEAQPTIHYYTQGIGLIKKELIDSNQVWNLIEYHIY